MSHWHVQQLMIPVFLSKGTATLHEYLATLFSHKRYSKPEHDSAQSYHSYHLCHTVTMPWEDRYGNDSLHPRRYAVDMWDPDRMREWRDSKKREHSSGDSSTGSIPKEIVPAQEGLPSVVVTKPKSSGRRRLNEEGREEGRGSKSISEEFDSSQYYEALNNAQSGGGSQTYQGGQGSSGGGPSQQKKERKPKSFDSLAYLSQLDDLSSKKNKKKKDDLSRGTKNKSSSKSSSQGGSSSTYPPARQ